MTEPDNIYEAGFVQDLFDRMAHTYGIVNLISSFGFTIFWRRACVANLKLPPGPVTGYDLMSGMGETWGMLFQRFPGIRKLTAVDFSESMVNASRKQRERIDPERIAVLQDDALGPVVRPRSADFVLCCFGLKTLDDAGLERLARKVADTLRPGGRFSFIEISDPEGWMLRGLFLFYLKRIIPLIGRFCLGDPANYRMLGVYTLRFKNSAGFARKLKASGLQVQYRPYFFGCATSVSGLKPES